MAKLRRSAVALLLALLMLFEVGEIAIASAVEEVDKALNPAEHLELTVPERFRDGGSWFFIPEPGYTVSEKSGEKLYIPIQRTGDLTAEAEVALKVTDITAKHDVNYQVALYKDGTLPQIIFEDMSIKDIALNAELQEEFEPLDSEDELGAVIHEAGGAELVDGEGNTIGTVTATPKGAQAEGRDGQVYAVSGDTGAAGATLMDEDAQEEPVVPGAVTEGEWTGGSATRSLMEARNAFTGTVSDRQALEGGSLSDLIGGNTMTEEEYNETMASAVQDNYPGKEYTLHFNAGEEAKFLVITPLYSEAAEGDAMLSLLLKAPSEGWNIGEDVNPCTVTILDEDEQEEVFISLASPTVSAKDGKVAITVTRHGRLNAMKGVTLTSWGGNAKEGDDYGGVGAKLWFPMGIQSRTVELPVRHGTEEKDFYLTINPLDDEQLGTDTTHVIIPAAETADGDDAVLMGQSHIWGSPEVTDRINIKGGYKAYAGYYDDYGGYLETPTNTKGTEAYIVMPTAKYKYAYDGMYLEYSPWVNWAHGDVWLEYKRNGSWTNVSSDHYSNDGKESNSWLGDYWGNIEAPEYASFTAAASKITGPAGSKSKIMAGTTYVCLIKRKFDVNVQSPEVKPLIGVSDSEILTNYCGILLDGRTASVEKDIWLDKSFTLTQTNSQSPLRLVGIEARIDNNGWYSWKRIATASGNSTSCTVVLTPDLINSLAEKEGIRWTEVGTGGGWNNSYKGEIIVRPVFDYIDTKVEIKNGQYGQLQTSAPLPYQLWDFQDSTSHYGLLGGSQKNQVRFYRGSDGTGTEYYRFTAEGNDPYLSLDKYVDNADNMRWIRVRARSKSGGATMQFYAKGPKSQGKYRASTNLQNDGEWHEYIIKTNGYWTGQLDWVRFDPLDDCANGDYIDVDYIAFFPDEASARGFHGGASTSPTMLWDFNSGENLSANMGKNWRNHLDYEGERDWQGNDYYVFTATDHDETNDPHKLLDPIVSMDTSSVPKFSDIQWVKIRAKNLSDKRYLQLFASRNGSVSADTTTDIELYTDGQWHEYVVNIADVNKATRNRSTTAWTDGMGWLRLDPLKDAMDHDQILIDYIAFFPSEANARAYRSATADPELLWDFGSEDGWNSSYFYYLNHVVKISDVTAYNFSECAQFRVDNTAGYYAGKRVTPKVDIYSPVADASKLRYLKLRIWNGFYATDGIMLRPILADGTVDETRTAKIPYSAEVQNSAGWKEMVVRLPESWSGSLKGLRLIPAYEEYEKDNAVSYYALNEIDYAAFFETEEEARAYRTVNTTDAREGHSQFVDPGTYAYHLGDRLSFTTQVNAAGENARVTGAGVEYYLRKGDQNGAVYNSVISRYINGETTIAMRDRTLGEQVVDRPCYVFSPTFTEAGNSIIVRVSESDYNNKFNRQQGIFNSRYSSATTSSDGWYYITVDRDVLANEIYELDAFPRNSGSEIPKWTLADGRTYYGNTLYHRSEILKENNVITLSTASGGGLANVRLRGTVTTSTMNVSTERSNNDKMAVRGALVSYGPYMAWTDEEGGFTLPAFLTSGSSTVRFTVTYNGSVTIAEASVPKANSPKVDAVDASGSGVKAIDVNAGVLYVTNVPANSPHVESVTVNQEGMLGGEHYTLSLNGKKLTVTVKVSEGGQYVANGETYTENIKEVIAWFQSSRNGEPHSQFSSLQKPGTASPAQWSWNPKTRELTIVISSFAPNNPESWDFGDVLMVRVITDRKAGLSAWEEGMDMVYEPVSTGYEVFDDKSYEPQTFEYDVGNMAEKFNISPVSDEDGNLLSETKASFGSFPYLGEITSAIAVFSKLYSTTQYNAALESMVSDLQRSADISAGVSNDDYDGAYNPEDDGLSGPGAKSKSVQVGAIFRQTTTSYGAERLMLGVVVTYGGGQGYASQQNPWQSKQMAHDVFGGFTAGAFKNMAKGSGSGNINYPDTIQHDAKGNPSEFGGAYFKVGVYFGIYFDFGRITVTTETGKKLSENYVLMGAGGFIGFNGTVGYTWQTVIVVVPVYFNVEAGIDLTMWLGATGNPKKTLEAAKNGKQIVGEDFEFNFDFKGRIYAKGTVGVGVYKVFGVRISLELGFEFGYSPKVTDSSWAQGGRSFSSPWGYTMEITFTGSVDLVVTSLDLYSASWPLPVQGGFLAYYQEMRRANKCIAYVLNGIEDGEGAQWARDQANRMVKNLQNLIDTEADDQKIREETTTLKNFAYETDIISWVAKNSIEMNKQGGVIGSIIEGVLQEDGRYSGIRFHTNDHVASQWVADDAQLMAAYGAVKSTPIMENAYAQPSSKIIGIGGGKYLMVFLDDTQARDKTQAATLKWTVYDSRDDRWTAPRVVQNDMTVDSKPNLTDAGDKVILSWASITDAKYTALKQTVATEKGIVYSVDPDTQVVTFNDNIAVNEALEADPARVMSAMDIFSVEFSKTGESFGEIKQLSDDAYYDDSPMAVYDADSGDYIVLYYKTAQDDAGYDDAGQKLLDIAGASSDPNKTYSVIAYMLYNGTVKDDNGTTVPVGWLDNYLFRSELPDNMTSEQFIQTYGPERYLESAVKTDGGGQADPPIYDLTVAPGYNHRAAFAFTLDRDYNLKTAEDKELYVQFYNFNTHRVNPPVRVAGSVTEETELYDKDAGDFVTVETTRQVDVGAPKLIRNGGSTWLFWREDGKNLKYLNVSEMMSARVASVANPAINDPDAGQTAIENEWTWAVKSDGSFATDAATGRTYQPNAKRVDFGSLLTEDGIEITDYEAITDEEDNLYIVWTDTVTREETNEIGEAAPVVSQEIYASAMIQQEETAETAGGEDKPSVCWSKPYRLTRDNGYNDGLALALDENGGLIIVHNQYFKKNAESEAELEDLIQAGSVGLVQDKDGKYYAPTLSYNTPVRLMVTRCDKIGSVEATKFTFTDDYPVPGETVTVKAVLENVGLTAAKGYSAAFYEYKDGVQGKKIYEYPNGSGIQVNSARQIFFPWTVPEDGPAGYSIQAVIQEQKTDGGYYGAVSSYSDTFEPSARIDLAITGAKQEGDLFRVDYEAVNSGNADIPEGASLGIRLVGLYGDLNSERYGYIENSEIYRVDVQNGLARKTAVNVEGETVAAVADTAFTESKLLELPASVFQYCGYDALQLVLMDKNGSVLGESDQFFVKLETPVNLSLNGGSAILLQADAPRQVKLDYEATLFMDEERIVYSTEDQNIATVSADGTLTGVTNGKTTLTATMLPSGRSASVDVTVTGGEDSAVDSGDDTWSSAPTASSSPSSSGSSSSTVQPSQTTTAFSDVDQTMWYYEGVRWAVDHELMNGIGDGKFDPNGDTSRAMLVTMLWRLEGQPQAEQELTFRDVDRNAWYTQAVRWATQQGIVTGYDAAAFGPNDRLTREQLALILCRYAAKKGTATAADGSLATFQDTEAVSAWALDSLDWAVSAGIVNGTGNGMLSPQNSASRAQVATMLMRYATKNQ